MNFAKWGMALSILCACGSGGEPMPPAPDVDRPTENIGRFYDTVVIGLEYTSASGSGVTDAEGVLDIAPGEDVTFSVGGVTLGTVAGSSIMTPLDLFAGSDLDANQVVNVIRFLLAVDEDGDPSNGIVISAELRAAAADWSVSFDMAPASFDDEFSEELAEAGSINGTSTTLWDVEDARMHFTQTYYCAYSGVFSGTSVSTVTGTDGIDDEAVFTVVFTEGGAGIQGVYSDTVGNDFGTIWGDAIAIDSERAFVVGDVVNGGTFEGAFVSGNWIEGTWDNPDEQEGGTFAAARVGYLDDAKWRFTGMTDMGDDFGMDIASDGTVTGAIRLNDQPALASGTISGHFDEATGALTATATTPDGDSELEATISTQGLPMIDGTYPDGTFYGTGCKLR